MFSSSRFTTAIHMLTAIEYFKNMPRITSEFLAGSVNTNPVVIRRLLGQLKDAGLITIKRGTGGASLTRPPQEITLLDIYQAMQQDDNKEELFRFHENPELRCPVGGSIQCLLNKKFASVYQAMAAELQKTTLADLCMEVKERNHSTTATAKNA